MDMPVAKNDAPGEPGIEPAWTSSAKSGVGTAYGTNSRIWFTISHGIFNEIYYPRVDTACTRDMGMIVTDGKEYFSEEKRHTASQVEYMAKGVPAYHLVNTANDGCYRIEKEILADPDREAIIQRTRFTPLKESGGGYHLYVLLAPHLGNQGRENNAWVGEYKGEQMLFAQRGAYALALACSAPLIKRSVGYAGTSDGWQDLSQHYHMEWEYNQASNGNVALTAEIDVPEDGEPFLLVIGFGRNPSEAGQRARASLLDDFETKKENYVKNWQDWQATIREIESLDPEDLDLYQISMSVLLAHEAKSFAGGIIASLSIPWGFSKSDDDLGGYHLVWPRDLVETVGGLLAAGAQDDARRVLDYLHVTQEVDGHWPQNMWLDGRPYWQGVQMDETAFPLLLVDTGWREGILHRGDVDRYWPMVKKAAAFLVCNGPVTQQDRWEEDPGYSPFTLAVEIAGLLSAADISDMQGESSMATYLREVADYWNANIERWMYITDTPLARQHGIEGYYVRISPPDTSDAATPLNGYVAIKNRPPSQTNEPASQIISPDALALVRFGLRAADDPRILNTVRVIDALLKVDFPSGPCWHRYNDDGYGEHEDGSPFDGTGIGRAWPLLTGERAHYELAAGRRDEAKRLLKTMRSFANKGGMLPEQVWDSRDIPEDELFYGHPSGSAMPLVWAHAEYIKLCRSLDENKVFDMPPQTIERYQVNKTTSKLAIWRYNQKIRSMAYGLKLRVETWSPARIHWSTDGWKTAYDVDAKASGLGTFYADLPTDKLNKGSQVIFTFYWPGSDKWEGQDYTVQVE